MDDSRNMSSTDVDPEDIEFDVEIDSEFWDVYKDLVKLVYLTDPEDRLGIVVPELETRYGPTQSDVYTRIENHVLRTVAFMETFKDKDSIASHSE